jgi:hypothetical protein
MASAAPIIAAMSARTDLPGIPRTAVRANACAAKSEVVWAPVRTRGDAARQAGVRAFGVPRNGATR